MSRWEVNEAAEIIHGVAHPDANIIFGSVIDDAMGDEVKVTVIAAGFERWDDNRGGRETPQPTRRLGLRSRDEDEEIDLGDDDFDVPSFLK